MNTLLKDSAPFGLRDHTNAGLNERIVSTTIPAGIPSDGIANKARELANSVIQAFQINDTTLLKQQMIEIERYLIRYHRELSPEQTTTLNGWQQLILHQLTRLGCLTKITNPCD